MSNRPLLQNGSIRKSDMQGNELVEYLLVSRPLLLPKKADRAF